MGRETENSEKKSVGFEFECENTKRAETLKRNNTLRTRKRWMMRLCEMNESYTQRQTCNQPDEQSWNLLKCATHLYFSCFDATKTDA